MRTFIRKVKNRTKTTLHPVFNAYYKNFGKHSFPDFILFGAMKSGTTSLFQYLAGHPELLYSTIKEPSFFSYKYNAGLEYYLNHFPLSKDVNNKLVFEASVTYLHDPKAANRIKKIIPNVKLIAILRDPIERAISHYNYYSSISYFTKKNQHLIEKRPITQVFTHDMNGLEKEWNKKYCQFSLYGKQLKSYYRLFDSKNILILDFDDLKRNSKETLYRISEFLGIDSSYFGSYEETEEKIKIPESESFNPKSKNKLNVFLSQNYSIELSQGLEDRLIAFYKEDVETLHKITGKTFNWSSKYINNIKYKKLNSEKE